MGSDRARISYDERQQYRSVVMQQGRVTLEADWNESQVISGEETRNEALDFVGPSGTPDDGYAITFPNADFDFQVGAGTMYVGGVRASLAESVQYGQQSDWLDNAIDPDWVPVPQETPGNEYVTLLLREQEISAVEDSDLKDAALGGPDTAQRTRLIQHIERLSTTGTDCPSALTDAQNHWAQEGLVFDPATMRLNSEASLLVSFTNTGPAPTPCDPTAQGGYLGADNQLIRVKISSADIPIDAGAGPGTSFLWGFDDASFLYRVTVIDPKTVKLQAPPVDAEHYPQAGQAIEILVAGASLASGEYVAAPEGFVTTLAAGYNADAQTVSLQDSLPAICGDGTPNGAQPPRVFLRVWRQQLAFTPGTPVALGDTGVQVTLQTANQSPFHVGDFWMYAMRPSTPQQVYPERYLTDPQPPDGPLEWACPLAVIQWTAGGSGSVLSDCRNPFDNLVTLTRRKLGGCCTVNVSPADLARKSLQTILDQFRGAAGVNICFAPGIYKLTRPLLLTAEHSNFNFEACSGGVIFQVAEGAESKFLQGMIVLNRADSVSFRGIQFQLPLVSFGTTSIAAAAFTEVARTFVSVALRPVWCTRLTVLGCNFEYPAALRSAQVAVGILAAGECVGLRLERNRFEMQPTVSETGALLATGTSNFVAGFVLFPTTISKAISPILAVQPGATGQVLASFFHDALVRDNLFSGLTLPVFVYADCGLAQFESNTVRNCSDGLWFLSLPSLGQLQSLKQVSVTNAFAVNGTLLQNALFTSVFHPALQLAASILRGFPLPEKFDLSHAIPVTLPRTSTTTTTVPIKDLAPLQDVFNRAATAAITQKVGKTATARLVKIGELADVLVDHPVAALAAEKFNVAILNQNYAAFEKQAFLRPVARGVPVTLQFADNDINTQVIGVSSGLSLLIFSLGRDDRDSVSVTGSTFVGVNGSGPVSLIFGVSRCMHTGNMVLNEGTPPIAKGATPLASLWLFPLGVTSSVDNSSVIASAITGNVFRGVPILPARHPNPTPPAPMNTWNFFNAET
jgi:Family of unknown function (DUF6519)